MRLLLRFAIAALICTFAAIPNAFAAGVDVFVYGGVTDDIFRFDGVTGTPLGIFAHSHGTMDMVFGPNGDLFVISGPNESILRFDGNSGALLGTFASMKGPKSLAFGPNGDLFVTDGPSQSILRFDGITGAPLGTFASVGGPRSLAFGPNGDLYASSGVTNSILRFDGTTGLPLGIFAHTADDCLGCTFSMSFGPGDDLYVAEGTEVIGTNRLYGSKVRRFDGTTGAPLGTFLSSPGLHDFAFGPDGDVFVSSGYTQSVLRFDEETVSSLGTVAPVQGPWSLAIRTVAVPEPGGLALTATGLLILLIFAHRFKLS